MSNLRNEVGRGYDSLKVPELILQSTGPGRARIIGVLDECPCGCTEPVMEDDGDSVPAFRVFCPVCGLTTEWFDSEPLDFCGDWAQCG